ncbi:Prolyl 4-hydroxylase alpha subunit [Penicillium malachiteum]|uniref:Prolyl 4-hydroxylase alpha subunit n=1 Tax=Penicillium malachiteum TaxID=1324776 RepID=UPI00254776B5|nr:Prolyl 4-hydroxylase alpha subunit [Penicillium malachiteum]KAJ5731093.1 Prolyl 4-hydroxylase alpha subunit [Penicillium malachiteum]
MSMKQNSDFLRGPPQNASVHHIDFTRTTPPIMAFKDRFAAVIENFISEAECTELLRLAEESTNSSNPNTPIWERAMINAGGGKQVMSVDTRKSGRIILDSADIAQRILDRLMPFMRDFNIDTVHNMPLVTGLGSARRGESYQLSGINERLRFLRYEGGDYFRPHWDGTYVTPDGNERSLFTIHLYLNGDGEQDMEELMPEIERAEKRNALFVKDGEVDLMDIRETQSESGLQSPSNDVDARSKETLLGGATSFTDDYRASEVVRVFPKTGSLLIFQQRNLMHCGDDVFRGIKYTVRSDLMYTLSE